MTAKSVLQEQIGWLNCAQPENKKLMVLDKWVNDKLSIEIYLDDVIVEGMLLEDLDIHSKEATLERGYKSLLELLIIRGLSDLVSRK